MHHVSTSNDPATIRPDLAIVDFKLDLVECTPSKSRRTMLAKMVVRIGADTYPVLVSARGYCIVIGGPDDHPLRRAIQAEALRIVGLSLQEAAARGRNALAIMRRFKANARALDLQMDEDERPERDGR
ncbi:hypothetical protein [Roseomonas haemaphysalidis]|uniref:Uncharacterized protein n=1 Tax=Roseomonas haemaphysalidis TaxID=2768162 RepID=A0ABS3KWN9_9PROT|nr:hypothetical protein [Roseomonas haemaphysalidis]MBO1081854.1 hypothetical protein [Roseomonas haemaphysalidis]